MSSPSRPRDKLFYGWVIIATCFIINALAFGTRYSFGVFFKSIEGEFSLNRVATSGIFSVYMVLASAFEVLGGWALDRFGPRIVVLLMGLFIGLSLLLTSQTTCAWQLFITYSLLLAIGTGPSYTVAMATISRWFDKKRGVALGIAGAGIGLGTLVMAPLATYLIANFEWRVSYIVIGLITGLILISLSRLMRRDPGVIGVLPDGLKPDSTKIEIENDQGATQSVSFSLLQALRTRSFWFFGSVWLMWGLCLHLVLTHVIPHATDMGISATKAAVILSLIGGISIPGRLIMGVVSDRIGRKVSAAICALLQAGAMVWLIGAQDLWMFYLFALVYGLGYGGFDPPTLALIGDIFGLRHIGVIMGAMFVGWGIGAAIGPALGGFLFDISNNYSIAFIIGSASMLAAALLVVLIKPVTQKNTLGYAENS
ncbi:MFS transporter [Chloroflexota bacterium]